MPHEISRRDLISRAAAAAFLTGVSAGSTLASSSSDTAQPLFRISLAEWSLHRTLNSGKLSHLEFSEKAKSLFGIEAVEYVNQFFRDKAGDAAYLKEMNRRAADAGVQQLLIMIDGEGQLGAPSLNDRMQAVRNHYPWVEAARTLGCHAIRVNAASSGTWEDQLYRAADGLRALTEYAAKYEINVIVENHGGLSSNGKWLAAVIRRVNHQRCGTLPDFGNFRVSDDVIYDRYDGVAELMPFARAVSAKSHDFADNGDETHTDYRRMMQIVLDVGYHGWVGIEYEGSQLDEFAGIRATLALLEKVRSELSA